MSATSVGVVPYGECLRGEGLLWLVGAVMCLLAASWVQLSGILRCSTISSCRSAATSYIVKRAGPIVV